MKRQITRQHLLKCGMPIQYKYFLLRNFPQGFNVTQRSCRLLSDKMNTSMNWRCLARHFLPRKMWLEWDDESAIIQSRTTQTRHAIYRKYMTQIRNIKPVEEWYLHLHLRQPESVVQRKALYKQMDAEIAKITLTRKRKLGNMFCKMYQEAYQ